MVFMTRNDYSSERKKMVDRLIKEGIVKKKEVARALMTVFREEFVWPDTKRFAYEDTPLPLGDTGQTISAPHMVAIMLEELELDIGMNVLEIGTGSGYNVALISEIVQPTPIEKNRAKIISVERVSELVKFAKDNLERTGYCEGITVSLGDGTLGYPQRSEEMLYDRIVVTAASPHIPKYLKAQLKSHGIILAPIGNTFTQTLVKATKTSGGEIKNVDICECMFVALVGENGFSY